MLQLLVLLFAAYPPMPLPATGEAYDIALLKSAGLPDDGPSLVEHLKRRTPDPSTITRIRQALAVLSDDRFEKREAATLELVKLGPVCRSFLIEASRDADFEVADRAKHCLAKIKEWHSETILGAVVRRLVAGRPQGAEQALLRYLPSAEDVGCADEVREGLLELARSPVTSGAIKAALKDEEPAIRLAAALALIGSSNDASDASQLLRDPNRDVRLGLALASLKGPFSDKSISALLELMPAATHAEGCAIEDALYELAGDSGPPAQVWPSNAQGRTLRRNQWAAWVANRSPNRNMSVRTLVVLLDKELIQDLDAQSEPLHELTELQFPLDAEPLPGGRVLVAEHAGNKVTLRNMKNQVLWEKAIEMPLVAQHLGKGRVMVATAEAIIEFDSGGKEVRRMEFSNEKIMKCHRLAGGETGIVLQDPTGENSRFLRLDRYRRPVGTIPVKVKTSGGRIDWHANGHVLVPELEAQRVVEYDTAGKAVWEAAAELPVFAVWLPNGNVMVTSRNENGALEMDRAGKKIWSYKIGTRVTRALRH